MSQKTKTCLRVSSQVPHKLAKGIEILDLESRGMYYLCGENKGPDQLSGYPAADLRLCFHIMQEAGFLFTGLILMLHFVFFCQKFERR